MSRAAVGELSRAQLDASVGRSDALATGLLFGIVAMAVAFLVWLYRMQRRLGAESSSVLSWIVFVPLGYRIVQRIWHKAFTASPAWIVFGWWVALQLSIIVGMLHLNAERHAQSTFRVEAFAAANLLRAGASALWAVASAACVLGFVAPLTRLEQSVAGGTPPRSAQRGRGG